MAADVGLPSGFQLDLPQGFQLDHTSTLEQEGYGARPVLRAVRDVASSAAGAVDIVEKPVRLTIAEGLDALGHKDAAKLLRNRATLHDTVQQGIDKATGGLTAPKSTHDEISDTIGELIAPLPTAATQLVKGAKAANQAVELAPKAKTAEEYTQLYRDGREALKNVELAPEQVQEGLVTPIQEALKHEHPELYAADVQPFLDKLTQFARKGVNANALESFRQALGKLPANFREPIRDAIDNFYESAGLPDQFRNAYAVMKRGQTLDNALTRAGDSLTKQRNAINNFLTKEKGLTDYEREVLSEAGKSSTTEEVLRKVGTLTGPIAGYVSFGISHNPLSLAVGGVGQALRAGANKIAKGKIEKAVTTIKGRNLDE